MYSKFVLDTTKKKAIDLLAKRSNYLTLPYQISLDGMNSVFFFV